MTTIGWDDFMKVELRVGRVVVVRWNRPATVFELHLERFRRTGLGIDLDNFK